MSGFLDGPRPTSAEAYRLAEESGLLSRMRLEVFRFLCFKGPSTQHEIDVGCAGQGERAASYHKRVSELVKMGVVAEVGQRPCTITKNQAVVWDVTGRMPTSLPPRVSSWREQAGAYRATLLEMASLLQRGSKVDAGYIQNLVAMIDRQKGRRP